MENTIAILQSLQPAAFDAGTLFSGTPSGKMVKGYAVPSLFTPAVDGNYIFHEQSRDIVVWFIDTSDPLYVYGPTGCGKTTIIKQLAAKLNYPVFEVTGHSRLEFPELVGHHVVRQGNMEFEYGPLALAMKFGGLFLCNEMDLLEPSTAAGLNGILDGQPLCIPENGGELVVPHPMFRFAATALRTRLQALMQSTRSVRNHSGYVGALNIHKLQSLAAGNAKVFLRKGERVGVNTAVHILIDSSGSMNGKDIQLACQACFAVASALQSIKGISVGVTTFPGERGVYEGSQREHWETVTPVLRHGEKMHTRFAMSGAGNTPLDSALWWTVQELHPMPESRKMILIITDGQPDNPQLAQTAITEARKLGLEVYGIGIANASILSLLPDTSSVINSIAELAPSMFGMLQRALIAGHPAA